MRKFTLFLSLCILAFSGFAQRASTKVDTKFTFEQPKADKGGANQILVPASFENGTPTIYTTSAGGYVCGANGYEDAAKAQHFDIGGDTYMVEGVMLWVGAQEVTDGNLKFAVYGFDGMPTTELASIEVPFSQVTSTEVSEAGDFFYTVMFDSPVAVTGEFAVGVEFTGITDGFGLVSTSEGDGGVDAWELWSDGTWYSFLDPDAWELDIDQGIFALVNNPALSAAEILAFSFPEDVAPAMINSESATVTSYVALGTDLSNLTPSIVVSPGAQVTLTTTDFTSPVEVLVGAIDGSTKTWTVTVSAVDNFIVEGDFPTDGPIAAPWGTWSGNGGVAEVIDGVCVNTPGAAAANYQLQVNQVLIDSCENEKSYMLSFTAWADADRVFSIDFEDRDINGYNRYGDSYDADAVNGTSEWAVALTTVPTVYQRTVTFKRILENTIQKVNIMTSEFIEKVYIDNISLVAIDTIAIQDVNVTFNMDMNYAIRDNKFVVGTDVLYLTGSFNGWDEPGTGESVILTDENSDGIYTITLPMPGYTADIKYKYFINPTWATGDQITGDRTLVTTNVDIATKDTWLTGIKDMNLSAVTLAPNPFNGELIINNAEGASQIVMSNLLGQTVMVVNEISNRMVLSTEGLNKGVYIVTIVDNNNNRRTERVIKQ